MLVYLLAKPHDWQVNVENLRNAGGGVRDGESKRVGRDRVYAMLNRLIETGYLKRVTKRGARAQFASHEYIVYDDPVPDQLPLVPRVAEPLPENPELAEPRPENQEVAAPFPEKPLPDSPDTEKPHALLNPQTTNPQSPHSLFPEHDSNDRFTSLIAGWPGDKKPKKATKLLRRFSRFHPDEQVLIVEKAAEWRRWMYAKDQSALMTTYFETTGWRVLADAPAFDGKGRFIVKPGTPWWTQWIGWIEDRYGADARRRTEERGVFLPEAPYPPKEAKAA
ncbi:hypothetical protein [Oricola sp.]|uniref:hypothetical protein n=1 Tax=Oricola sp. TaxID=1979950 RepID=UPI003BAD7D43